MKRTAARETTTAQSLPKSNIWVVTSNFRMCGCSDQCRESPASEYRRRIVQQCYPQGFGLPSVEAGGKHNLRPRDGDGGGGLVTLTYPLIDLHLSLVHFTIVVPPMKDFDIL